MKNLFFAMLIALGVCLTGCGGQEMAQKDTLLICVEQGFGDDVRNLLELWESMNNGISGKVEVLSKDSDTREIQISNLRTELMAGGGPDIFIPSCGESVLPTLFNNLEKTMYTDTFLPLDTFLETSEHVTVEDWNQMILEAGRTEEGQVILPLTYYYQKYAFPSADMENIEKIPVTFDELKECKNLLLQETMLPQVYQFDLMLGKLVDYEAGKLLYSKEELKNHAEDICKYIVSIETQEMNMDTSKVLRSAE